MEFEYLNFKWSWDIREFKQTLNIGISNEIGEWSLNPELEFKRYKSRI